MKNFISIMVFIAGMGWTAAVAQAPAVPGVPTPAKKPVYTNAALFTTAARPFSVTRADPGMNAIIAPDAKAVMLGERFGLTEGPVWIREGKDDGFLLFSDLIENVIYKIQDGAISVYLDKAGYSGKDTENAGAQTRRGRTHVLMIGPNGETVDPQGHLVWGAANDGTIVRLESDGTRTVIASGIDGKRFDGPNDLVIKKDGAIYLTDGDWGLRGRTKSPLKQLPYEDVSLIKNGKATLLLTGQQLGGSPNGVALSPDEKYLYLNAGRTQIKRYEILADDTLAPGTVLSTASEANGSGIGDGMKTDTKGNIYTTSGAGPGVVRVTAPDGKYLGSINLPVSDSEPKRQICATNVAFGDADGKTLFITACEAVYKVRLKVAGVVPGPESGDLVPIANAVTGGTPGGRGDGPSPAKSTPFSITRTDPELDKIISPSAKLVQIGDFFGLTEGPVWVRDGKSGYLLFSDLIANTIYKIDAKNKTSVFLTDSGYSGDDINNAGSESRRGREFVLMIGPNGETLDPQGRLVWGAANDGTVVRLEKDGTKTVLSSGIDGKRFDGPNDLAIKSDGAIYLTDGDWGLRDRAKSPLKQLPYEDVALIKDGKTTLLLTGAQLDGSPNGVALSPDEKYLYLTAAHQTLKRYPINADDTLGTPTVITQGPGIGDGMKTDTRGNIYNGNGGAPGLVRITAPDGKWLGNLNMPMPGGEPKREICATNMAFGGNDGKTLFITGCEVVWKVQLKVAGVVPGPKP